MKSGGWTQAESYRDLIKDKEAAISLEQQSRIQLTGESLDQQIAETYASHQAEPENVDSARRLGALSEQKDDFESAIAGISMLLISLRERTPDCFERFPI